MRIYFKFIDYFSKSRIPARQAGFTFLEFIVVMTIAVIMMTSLVIQQSRWSDRLTVNTQAYELALMLRQAQIYSLGVREYTAGAGDKFDIGYGVHFDSNLTRYIYFADADKDQKYDTGEAIETKIFTRGVTIDRFCGIRSGDEDCAIPLDHMSISFLRPEPKANISFLNGGDNPSPGYGPPASVYLKSVENKQYKVTIEANGQISIMQI